MQLRKHGPQPLGCPGTRAKEMMKTEQEANAKAETK